MPRAVRIGTALCTSVVALGLMGNAAAHAQAGKVLVFTGTTGTANAATAAAVTALQANATAGGYTVDSTADAAQISAANLANYRAVVFVNSAGDVLNAAQESSLTDYVNGGGGFVGIGETAKLEEGNAAFDTLVGLTGNPRTTAASAASIQDVEFLDRVHPATRDLSALVRNHNDNFFQWTNNPTGQVHTVARVRFNSIPGPNGVGRESVTNDAVTRFTGTTNTIQPQSQRALSWCRDLQQGRSFYTGMGQTTAAFETDNVKKHLASAVQWAAGMVRGNCKATINSNYTQTRLTPANPTYPNQPAGDNTASFNPFMGEIDALAMAKDGRVFYAGRAVCFQGQQQNTNWTHPQTSLGCGPIYVYDPRGSGSIDQNPARIAKVADFSVQGAKGGGSETGATAKTEQGILGIALDPDFPTRPYIYVVYHPYWGGEMGKNTTPTLGRGFSRADYMGERRLSRFTYNETTKTITAGSERVIQQFQTQVFSCCHLGGSMDWDSAGNLYVATGDNTGNNPNSATGGYTNAATAYTVPCAGDVDLTTYEGTGCAVDTSDPDGAGPLPPRTPCAAATMASPPRGSLSACGYISYGDARQTSGNTNTFEGKLLRLKPNATINAGTTPGIGTTYTIPGPDAPNGGNLFPPNSQPVLDGKAKPEVFAMGVRNLYSIDVDSKTDKISAAWVGPDTGTNSPTWGPAKTENAVQINSAGNYGWPYCTGNQQGYRAKLPSTTGGGLAAPLGHPGTVGGGADGATGGFWDCDDPNGIVNESPFNTGLERIPPARSTNIWYGPQGGCYDFPRNANGVPIYNNTNTGADPASFRRCPFVFGVSGQAPMTAGTYRKPAGDSPDAWPAYWDGRWFLADYAGANNLRHALMMDPATEFTGGQPIAADSLYGIIPTTLMGNNRIIDLDFGPDGALYVADYGGANFAISNANNAVRRFAYTGGPDTPGPDPQVASNADSASATFAFNTGRSGGVSHLWEFSDGGTSTATNPTHTFKRAGNGQPTTATLTVTYSDGATASKTLELQAPTVEEHEVSVQVPKMLRLSLAAPTNFGAFTPGTAMTHHATTVATVTSSMEDAALTISDQSGTNPGFLVNGTATLAQRLRIRNSASAATPFSDVSATPVSLASWTAPTTNATVNLQFQQSLGATEALKHGSYSKRLTFVLSTTRP